MDAPRKPTVRHLVFSALFLAVVLAFWLRYGLILFGFAENQIPQRAPVSWRIEGARVWIWHQKNHLEEYAKQNALLRIPFSEMNMGFRKLAGMRLFPDADNILRLNNGHLVIPQKKVDTGDCSRQIIALRNVCSDLDIPFLYVMALHKSDPFDSQLPRGMEDHCDDNADQFVASLAASGVAHLDLRGLVRDSVSNYYGAFFRGDHHWKPEIGLWAASQIAQELNRRCRMELPAGLLDPANYDFKIYPRYFLGSLGRKVTRAYIAPEDFSIITPKFDTSFSFSIPARGYDRSGAFRQTFIAEDCVAGPPQYYRQDPFGAYAQGNNALLLATNFFRPEGKHILVIKDSFANVVVPFLALAVRRLDVLDPRHFTESVYGYIEKDPPDAVVVIYSADSFALGNYNVWRQRPLPVPVSLPNETKTP